MHKWARDGYEAPSPTRIRDRQWSRTGVRPVQISETVCSEERRRTATARANDVERANGQSSRGRQRSVRGSCGRSRHFPEIRPCYLAELSCWPSNGNMEVGQGGQRWAVNGGRSARKSRPMSRGISLDFCSVPGERLKGTGGGLARPGQRGEGLGRPAQERAKGEEDRAGLIRPTITGSEWPGFF
ncbi:hypothetical protein NL676_007073 [Syzygium grande]|nr:hypothetical protein NL676_007073 [Syzygium grande]